MTGVRLKMELKPQPVKFRSGLVYIMMRYTNRGTMMLLSYWCRLFFHLWPPPLYSTSKLFTHTWPTSIRGSSPNCCYKSGSVPLHRIFLDAVASGPGTPSEWTGTMTTPQVTFSCHPCLTSLTLLYRNGRTAVQQPYNTQWKGLWESGAHHDCGGILNRRWDA